MANFEQQFDLVVEYVEPAAEDIRKINVGVVEGKTTSPSL